MVWYRDVMYDVWFFGFLYILLKNKSAGEYTNDGSKQDSGDDGGSDSSATGGSKNDRSIVQSRNTDCHSDIGNGIVLQVTFIIGKTTATAELQGGRDNY